MGTIWSSTPSKRSECTPLLIPECRATCSRSVFCTNTLSYDLFPGFRERVYYIFGVLFMVMKCSEQQDKQLIPGPLGPACCLYKTEKRKKENSCYRQTPWNSVTVPCLSPNCFWSYSSLPAIIPINFKFLKPSSPRSPFQHHLATEGGCHGNTTHMSPATFPVTVATGSLQNFKHVTQCLCPSLSLSFSFSCLLWVRLPLPFSHENIPTCLVLLFLRLASSWSLA